MKPSGRSVPAGKVRQDRVVVSPAEDELHRVDAEGGADGAHRVGELEGVPLDVDGHPGAGGDVPRVGEQAVGDVDHRGRAGVGGGGSGGVRRLGSLVGLDQRAG